MSFPKLELAKRENPGLANILDELMAYIGRQIAAKQSFFLPRLAGAALGLNDGEAYVLLEILARSRILDRVFNVYCRATGTRLATVEREDQLDEIPYCDDCDCHHDPHELRLEIAFRLANSGEIREAA